MNAEKNTDLGLSRKCKILVIDDDDTSRYMLRFLLEKDKHQVFEAADGEEGINKFREINPDLVITDIVMPKKEGLSLIKELRAVNSNLPVIAITSDVHGRASEFLELSKQVGATSVLEKPISHEKLANALFEVAHSFD